jgi:7,8-dihydropterin-6-yl-methyl-4-(beta-D-ribofuranosyl)aminobenzene 5'-phosphate synthase
MRITTLIENTLADDSNGLTAEHGLSLHISFDKKAILFDTGASDLFSQNADKLGVDISAVNAAVLSHHHYDHGGGLPRFFALNSDAKVCLKKPPDGDCYFKALLWRKRYIGLNSDVFKTYPARFAFIEEFTEILPDVYIFTAIGNSYPKPKGNRYLYVKRENYWSLDPFDHELILAVREDDKLVIFTGCSHNGMLNMIDTTAKKFSGIPIKAVIGGFHLVGLPKYNTMAGSKSQIQSIARKILDYPVQTLYTGHCTGQKAYAVLKSVLGEKLQHLHTGTILEL